MRMKAKTMMDRMNAENPDKVLDELEAKHGSPGATGSDNRLLGVIHDVQRKKEQHRMSKSCEFPKTCGACHFYSGYLAALADVMSGNFPHSPNTERSSGDTDL